MPPMSAGDEALKQEVRSFWEQEPCGSSHAEAAEGTLDFFAEVERSRAELEPFIADYADFDGTAGSRMLEIGVGLGTDLVRFARAGARVTGVDLTEHSVRLVRRRLELEGLEGDVRVADAEALPFENSTFDKVYSWGVLHHTPDSERAFREALRVLRPGGEACIMLYARRSWVAWGTWARHGPLAGRPFRSVSDVLAHHMESEGTKGYTRRELRRMFSALTDLDIRRVCTPYDVEYAGGLARLTGPQLGFFVVVRGRAPGA
jgi:SAM-dependent methyltransferase